VFILYSLIVGLALGFAFGGRPAGLARLRFRWSPLMLAGLLVQIVLFSEPVSAGVGDWGPPIYVGSTAVVLVAVLANVSIPGMALVGAGAVSNLAAIVANGGYMPAARSALVALGKTDPTTYSNSAALPNPALEPMTDIFAMPVWLPFANVFSVGDILIATGVASTIVLAMRRTREPAPALTAPDGSPAG
jgi:hypothetical protein